MATTKGDFSLDEVLSASLTAARKHWLKYLLFLAVMFGLVMIYNLGLNMFADSSVAMAVGLCLSLVGGAYLKITLTQLSLLVVREHKFAWPEALMTSGFDLIHAVIGSVMFAILKIVGLIFLIVPGIIAAITFPFFMYTIVDKHVSGLKALEDSLNMTKGNRWTIFWFYLILGLGALAVMVGTALLVLGGLVILNGPGDIQNLSATGMLGWGVFLVLMFLGVGVVMLMLSYSGTAYMYIKMRAKTSLNLKL